MASAAVYVDSSKANVLRQSSVNNNPNNLNKVTGTITGTGLQTGLNSNDGSGAPDQWFMPGAGTGTATYNLPGPTLVNSYRTNFAASDNYLPASFLLEGFTTSGWTSLVTTMANSGQVNFSGGPQTVTALRYTVPGPSNNTYIQNIETQVFLAAGQTIDYASGYNILRDNGKFQSETNSITGNKWIVRSSSQGADALRDGDYFLGLSIPAVPRPRRERPPRRPHEVL